MKLKAPEQVSVAATFASIPWCCVLPGVLSLASNPTVLDPYKLMMSALGR